MLSFVRVAMFMVSVHSCKTLTNIVCNIHTHIPAHTHTHTHTHRHTHRHTHMKREEKRREERNPVASGYGECEIKAQGSVERESKTQQVHSCTRISERPEEQKPPVLPPGLLGGRKTGFQGSFPDDTWKAICLATFLMFLH